MSENNFTPSASNAEQTPLADTFLWEREGLYEPRIAAVHDLCGYGKCSLGVAIPVLSAAGCDVCPVPTSLFSAHTLFPDFYMLDTTSMLAPYLDAWEKEQVGIDVVYSGFLGAPEQIASIKRLYDEFPAALRILDPVMGDAGKMYPTYTPELCAAMGELVNGADVLLPNLTEAAILTHTDYRGQNLTDDEAAALIDALFAQGAKTVVLKGVEKVTSEGKTLLVNYVQNQKSSREKIEVEKLPYALHGTGDLFASCVLAAIMAAKSLLAAVEFASKFVRDAIQITTKQPDFERRGVSFEVLLGQVTQLITDARP